jgi:hypothetical protein
MGADAWPGMNVVIGANNIPPNYRPRAETRAPNFSAQEFTRNEIS